MVENGGRGCVTGGANLLLHLSVLMAITASSNCKFSAAPVPIFVALLNDLQSTTSRGYLVLLLLTDAHYALTGHGNERRKRQTTYHTVSPEKADLTARPVKHNMK